MTISHTQPRAESALVPPALKLALETPRRSEGAIDRCQQLGRWLLRLAGDASASPEKKLWFQVAAGVCCAPRSSAATAAFSSARAPGTRKAGSLHGRNQVFT